MGWLFAVALGLHRRSRLAVLLAIPPMALGHALSIGIVAALVLTTGMMVDSHLIRIASGVLLVAWAVYQVRYGHRHRVRVGMTTGFAGLVVWSFLMATAHGAGLMLIPALIPLCGSVAGQSSGPLLVSLAAVGLHTLATLLVTGAIASAGIRLAGRGRAQARLDQLRQALDHRASGHRRIADRHGLATERRIARPASASACHFSLVHQTGRRLPSGDNAACVASLSDSHDRLRLTSTACETRLHCGFRPIPIEHSRFPEPQPFCH